MSLCHLYVCLFFRGKFRDCFLATRNARNSLLERYYYGIKDDFVRNSYGTTGLTEALLKRAHDHNRKRDWDIISEENVKSIVLDTVVAATETAASALLNISAL